MYIGKRDFYDHIEHCEPVDGVVLVDRDHIKDKTGMIDIYLNLTFSSDYRHILEKCYQK